MQQSGLSQSDSASESIDITNSSTRHKKSIINKEIARMLQGTDDVKAIARHILELYPNILEPHVLEKEIRKKLSNTSSQLSEDLRSQVSVDNSANSSVLCESAAALSEQPLSKTKYALPHPNNGKNQQRNTIPIKQAPGQGAPQQKAAKNPITNFLVTNKQILQSEVNQLTQQVSELREENSALKEQIEVSQSEESRRMILNKVYMALKLHESEVEQINKKYEDSKQFEKYRNMNMTYYEEQIKANISLIQGEIDELNSIIEEKGNCSRYSSILAANELQQKLTKYQAELEYSGAYQEINVLNGRIFNNLKSKNTFKQFQLPCFYPTFALMEHPISSRKSDIKLPPNKPKYILLRLIGEGGFSKVFKAFNIETCEFVALKISQLEGSSDDKWKLIQREAAIYQDLKHPHIVRLNFKPMLVRKDPMSVVQGFDLNVQINSADEKTEVSEIALEMELCDDISLFEYVCIMGHRILNNYEKEENEKQLLSIFLQISDALRYLHDRNLTHNDISLTNILKQNSVWKLSDFSLAKEFDEDVLQQNVTTLGTTKPFAPPEKILHRKFSPASDMYSFGVTVFVSFTGELQFFEKLAERFMKKEQVNPSVMVAQWFEEHQCEMTSCQGEVEDMICQLVDLNYQKRPTARQVFDSIEKILKKGVKRAKK